ncbi:hypothetical protein M422DRAFT_55742 [Sphaerobolus stellatus SS14]|uniref:Uncharacterized protein n=1 Tax=Sphaerobolus stellatus (strain SS14) TaxID=990650 RepID=A0A0C9UA52_SPHS4|nr:hypothetical protein M422DRAFT_55742 [Sphaerobolus stellatus SS14]
MCIISRLIDPIYCDVYLKVIQDILGERSERTLDGVHMMHDGSWYGSTAFERSERAIPVAADTRCYTINLSHERQRKTNVPVAAAKREGLELDENQKIRQKLAKAWLPICTKVAEILPAANFEYWKLFNQLFNEPCLGHPTNYMHVSMQANFAGALPALVKAALTDPNSAGSLITVLGHFGTGHVDADHLLCLSSMGVGSDLPPDYHPGQFGILGAAIHWRLDKETGANFDATLMHGGTPARSPTSNIIAWAIHLLTIAYGPERMLNGQSSYAMVPNGTAEPTLLTL